MREQSHFIEKDFIYAINWPIQSALNYAISMLSGLTLNKSRGNFLNLISILKLPREFNNNNVNKKFTF